MSTFNPDDFAAGSLTVYVYTLSAPVYQADSLANNIHRLTRQVGASAPLAGEMLRAAEKLRAAASSLEQSAAIAPKADEQGSYHLLAAE